MKQKSLVAIVGRPNVGKSALFNRLIGERKAVVDDWAGITRDRIYGIGEWLTREFIVVDTGGLGEAQGPFAAQVHEQTQQAIEEADIIVFVVDSQIGITQEDLSIARQLRTTKKPIILVANKYDNSLNNSNLYDFLKLGLGEPLKISATHGIGTGDLLDQVLNKLPPEKKIIDQNIPRVAIIGKPNVGKSSLVNHLIGEERMIVSSVAGTTVDAIDSLVQYNKKKYVLVDTAGLKRKGKLNRGWEKYSYLRTLKAVNQADIVLLMVDVSEPISSLDTVVGGLVKDEHKPLIILANKWDLISNKDAKSRAKIEAEIRSHFKYLQYARFLFMTNQNKSQIPHLYQAIEEINLTRQRKLATSILNEIINRAQLINPPPDHQGGRLKIYYATQVEAVLPTFIMFVNNRAYLHFSYRRFLENQIRSQVGFLGVPLILIFKERR